MTKRTKQLTTTISNILFSSSFRLVLSIEFLLFASKKCECTGAKSYQILDAEDWYCPARRTMEEGERELGPCSRRRAEEAGGRAERQLGCRRHMEENNGVFDEEAHRELGCGRRVLEEGDAQNQRELPASERLSYDDWVDVIKYNFPGCALAPVKSEADLEFYDKLNGNCCCDCEALVGVLLEDPAKQACKCAEDDFPASVDGEDYAVPPDECTKGWINIVDGSAVPEDVWGPVSTERDLGIDSYGKVYGLAYTGNYYNPATLYAECDHDVNYYCDEFPQAVIECCEETTCYNPERRPF